MRLSRSFRVWFRRTFWPRMLALRAAEMNDDELTAAILCLSDQFGESANQPIALRLAAVCNEYQRRKEASGG